MAARQTIRHLSCKRRGTGEQVWREGVFSWFSPEGEIQKKQKNVERKLSTSTMCGAAMRHRTSVQQHLDDAGHAWPTERWVESRQVHENASFDTSEVPCVGAAMQEPRVCEGVLCAWLATTCARGASTSAQHKPTDTPTPPPPRQQGRHHPLPPWRQRGWQDPPPQPRVVQTYTHTRALGLHASSSRSQPSQHNHTHRTQVHTWQTNAYKHNVWPCTRSRAHAHVRAMGRVDSPTQRASE
jgi:hypothetical protein